MGEDGKGNLVTDRLRLSCPFTRSTSSHLFDDTVLQSEAVAYIQHRQREPGAWTIAQTDGASGVWPGAVDTEAIGFELVKCLPVPSTHVRIASILEFKGRRRDELYAFRVQMDEPRSSDFIR